MRKFKVWAFLLAVCFVSASCSTGKKVVNTPPPATTTMECTQLTNDGNYIIEVQSKGANVEKATDEALKYAVRGLLFDGIPGSSTNRIQSQQPLVKDPEVKIAKQEYFQNFFNNGDYRQYVETVPSIMPQTLKTKDGYRVTVSVILKKQLLRKRLEKDGIIKSLASPF